MTIPYSSLSVKEKERCKRCGYVGWALRETPLGLIKLKCPFAIFVLCDSGALEAYFDGSKIEIGEGNDSLTATDSSKEQL